MEKIAQIQHELHSIANTLESIQHPRAKELVRIAQYFENFNSNMNTDFNLPVQTMANESEEVGAEDPLNPGISSYVKMRPGEEPTMDDRKTHTCTVIFKSPEGVSEADMMNYILGIGGELGVDVESFKWSKSESKQMKTV